MEPTIGGPAAVRRPVALVLAAVVLTVMGVASLASAIVLVASVGGITDRFRRGAAGGGADQSEIESFVVAVRGSVIVAALLAIGAAVVLLALASANLRAGRGARLVTWLVCGIGLLCGCGSLVAVVVQRSTPLLSGTDQATADLLAALTEAYPSWWIFLNVGLSAAQAIGYFLVAILLAMPQVNSFQRAVSGPPDRLGPSTPTT